MVHNAILISILVGIRGYSGVRALLSHYTAGRLDRVMGACWIVSSLVLLGIVMHG